MKIKTMNDEVDANRLRQVVLPHWRAVEHGDI